MLKLTDYSLLGCGRAILGIDSDVMFFSMPQELIEYCLGSLDGYLFQRDPESTYNLTPHEAKQALGIELAPRVNTGILVFPRELPDLRAFERYLQNPAVAVANGFIEQTLYALHSSEIGATHYLPDSYAIDLRAGLPYDGIIARHYAGPSRPLMTAEGMPRVLKCGLFDPKVE